MLLCTLQRAAAIVECSEGPQAACGFGSGCVFPGLWQHLAKTHHRRPPLENNLSTQWLSPLAEALTGWAIEWPKWFWRASMAILVSAADVRNAAGRSISLHRSYRSINIATTSRHCCIYSVPDRWRGADAGCLIAHLESKFLGVQLADTDTVLNVRCSTM